nr:MAG TPA: hypothetical protein [Caudoviricetes sp.]
MVYLNCKLVGSNLILQPTIIIVLIDFSFYLIIYSKKSDRFIFGR